MRFYHLARLSQELGFLAQSTGGATFGRYLMALLETAPRLVRAKSLRLADAEMVRHLCEFRVDGDAWLHIPGEHFGLAREVIAKRIYTWPKGFEIRSQQFVLDLGANVGIFSLFASAHGADVLGVEAQDGFRASADRLFHLNKMASPSIVHALAGGKSGAFGDAGARASASHWQTNPQELSLEDLLRITGRSDIDMLKADIEGSEFELILRSSPGTLRAIRRMSMEVHSKYGRPTDLVNHLVAARFDVFLADGRMRRVEAINEDVGFLYATRA